MPERTGLVLLTLDIATVDGPGVEGQGTPVTQIVKVSGAEVDTAMAAAILRAQADRLDPPEPKRPGHTHPGSGSICRDSRHERGAMLLERPGMPPEVSTPRGGVQYGLADTLDRLPES